MDLNKALNISAAGMDAQTMRLRVIAENLANQDTTGSKPGADAYRRKTITFENRVDASTGDATVQVKRIGQDQAQQGHRFREPQTIALDQAKRRRAIAAEVLRQIASGVLDPLDRLGLGFRGLGVENPPAD